MNQYITQVHKQLEARFGVGLVQLGDDLFGRENVVEKVREAASGGLTVDQFIDGMERQFSLVPGDKVTTAYRAALVGFAEAMEGWHLDGQGGIVCQREEGILALSVGASHTEGFDAEFVASVAEGVNLEYGAILQDGSDGVTIPADTEFTEIARGIDIDVALLAFENEFVPGANAYRLS